MRWFPSAAAAAFALLPEEAAADLSCARGGATRCEVDGPRVAEAEAEQIAVDLVQARMQLVKAQVDNSAVPGWPRPSSLDGRGDVPPAVFLRSEAASKLSAAQRADMVIPVAWFHVSKTGTSILNTFYHTPAICPRFAADNCISSSTELDGMWDDSWGDKAEVCPGFSRSYGEFWLPDGAHMGLGGLTGKFFKLNREHLVTMLRQPEQRLISQYYHYGAVSLIDDSGEMFNPFDVELPKVALWEYAQWNGGCVVRQLTRSGEKPCRTLPLPTYTDPDIAAAVKVLQTGFAFIGITEQWDLSVCLFRAMFGGKCVGSDFLDTRPGANSSSSDYDTSELRGWVDTVDAPVYAEGLRLFERTRKLYGVDSDQCTSFCQGALP